MNRSRDDRLSISSTRARGVEILASRLRLLSGAGQRIPAVQADKPIVCGNLVLRPESSRPSWHGMDVGLTVGEYKIAHLLASNAGSYVTYRAIYDRLTYEGIAGLGDVGYRTNVRSAIKRFRNKFRECDPAFAEIENYGGVGYSWEEIGGRRRVNSRNGRLMRARQC